MILNPDLFVSVLAKTNNGIALLDAEGKYVRDLTKAEAAACMGTGNYQAVGRKNRLRYLRVRPAPERDSTFWDDRHLWTWSAADFGKAYPMRALDGVPV